MIEHETLDGLVEPAELGQKLTAPLWMQLDLRELVVVQRPGLLQDRVRHRQLAHVVEQSADGKAAQASGG